MKALEAEISAPDAFHEVFRPSMQEFVEEFLAEQIPVASLVNASNIFRDCTKILEENTNANEHLQKATMILGCLPGDIYYETPALTDDDPPTIHRRSGRR